MKLKEAELLVAEVGSAQAAILLTAQTNSAEEDEDLPAQLQEDAGSVPVTEVQPAAYLGRSLCYRLSSTVEHSNAIMTNRRTLLSGSK